MNKLGIGKAIFVKCDVTKSCDLDELVKVAIEKTGRIDCVVNNAGWHPPATSFTDTKYDDFISLINTNLVSYFYLSKYKNNIFKFK